jgi:transposase, IS6 family
VKSSTRCRSWLPPVSACAGFRLPPEVIVVAVRWYLRFNLSYRDVEELLVERGIEVDHVTVFRWVQRFTPLLADAARFTRHSPGDRWFVDETYVKVGGVWRYVYRAVDQHGQVIDVLVSVRRDAETARRFFGRALSTLKVTPIRGGDRRRRDLPRRARRTDSVRLASRRAVRHQSDRGRPQPTQAPAETATAG